jgi:hypothetical protein
MSSRTYLAFLPWVVFAFVGRTWSEGVAWGGVAALTTAVIIAVASARAGSVPPLEIAAIFVFAGFVIAGATHQHEPHGFLQQYFRAMAAGSLALIALVSLRTTPFTEPYAREMVLRKFWNTPRFKRVNVDLTLVWVMVFSAIALSYTAAAVVDSHAWSTVFQWIAPVALVLLGVKQSTLRWSEQFDTDAMGLDAMLSQTELWEPGPESPGRGI